MPALGVSWGLFAQSASFEVVYYTLQSNMFCRWSNLRSATSCYIKTVSFLSTMLKTNVSGGQHWFLRFSDPRAQAVRIYFLETVETKP